MSAAAAMPGIGPSPPYPTNGINGDSGSSSSPNAPNGERTYPHVTDLQRLAEGGFDPRSPISTLLETAETGLSQAKTCVDMLRRPDMAFIEYLRASEILLNVIPHHKDYVHLTLDQPERAHRLFVLQKRVASENERFAKIKSIIVNNNARSGVQPRGRKAPEHGMTNGTRHTRMESAPAASLQPSGAVLSSHGSRPIPSPKPEKLHGRALSTVAEGTLSSGTRGGTLSQDVLSDRFARLRMAGNPNTSADQQSPIRPDSRASNASSIHSSPSASMPSAPDYAGRASFDSLSRTTSNTSSARPYGPRSIPNGLSMSPHHPGNIEIPDFPQAPPVAYSPARNMQTTGNIAPPRHSARSLASSNVRRTSSIPSESSASYNAPNYTGTQSSDYFPSQLSRQRSVSLAGETRIGAERLYDSVRRFNVLLIDFRPREEFDAGHIHHRSIVCIDPLAVRAGMSAAQIAESLVLSPDQELDLFEQRDSFDLVVYYDADTQSDSYLTRPSSQQQAGLKYLHEALWDFNVDRPLQRPPILLMGGLEAWIDLAGQQSLVSTNTLARIRSQQQQFQNATGRLQRRRAVAPSQDNGGQLRVQRRRLRTYDPLGEDEERRWRERARAESVALPVTPLVPEFEGEEGGEGAEGDTGDEAYDAAIREFRERFPEANSLDRQAFQSQLPTRAPPPPPAKVPMYPSAPSASPLPQVPTRPAPAAPRMSYMGVSERTASTSSARSTSLAPYIPNKYLAVNLRLPKTGLINFGNTCYMNSTLQALSATTAMSVFFLDDAFHSQLQKDNWKGSKGVMPELYANLLRSLWKGDVDCIRPSTFRIFCGRIAKAFDNNDQQDAKEFFDFLVDCLHEDLNGMWARTPLRALTEQEEAKRERMPKLVVAKTEWTRYTHRDLSFVNTLFAGQHSSALRCRTCGFTSTTYEAFYSISVEIPNNHPDGRPPSLNDCLRSFCSEEYLTKDDQWNCPHCKTTREASKRITITRAPQHLVIHFKRFATSQSSYFSKTTTARKIRTPVAFPLTNLDLGPYMLPTPSAEETQSIAATYGSDAARADASMTPPFTYDAYAVIRHIGSTMQSGHYITAAKDRARGTWRMYNDKTVTEFDPNSLSRDRSLQNEEAYIVFYQRNGMGAGSVGMNGGGKM